MVAKSRSARPPKTPLTDVRTYRMSLGENQATFWARFGVTQSGGSRYESGRDLPTPVAILLLAYADGVVDDEALKRLLKRCK